MNFSDWSRAMAQYGNQLRAYAQAAQRPPAAPPAQDGYYLPLPPHQPYQDQTPSSPESFRAQSINPNDFHLADHANWNQFMAQARPSQLIEDHRRFLQPPGPQASPLVPFLNNPFGTPGQ